MYLTRSHLICKMGLDWIKRESEMKVKSFISPN